MEAASLCCSVESSSHTLLSALIAELTHLQKQAANKSCRREASAWKLFRF